GRIAALRPLPAPGYGDDRHEDDSVDTKPSGVNNTQVQALERQSFRLLAILGTLLAFASISTDLYLPALPRISVALGASEGTLQLTISAYLMGFGFGQLF